MVKMLYGFASLDKAKTAAKLHSLRYNTFWYVRKHADGSYSPWAHSTDDAQTVASFYCGRELKEA